jgi:hypothetical protein
MQDFGLLFKKIVAIRESRGIRGRGEKQDKRESAK